MYVGCLYLASKAEESALAAKHMVTYAKKMRPSWVYDIKHLLDIEMVRLGRNVRDTGRLYRSETCRFTVDMETSLHTGNHQHLVSIRAPNQLFVFFH